MTVEPPAGTTSRTWAAALVPTCSGFTVGVPCTTWSAMPSFGYAGDSSAPHSRAALDSLSQNSSVASSGACRCHVPSWWCSATTTRWSPGCARSDGFGVFGGNDHVLRNHSVGSRCSGASSGPRLCTVMRHRRSCSDDLA